MALDSEVLFKLRLALGLVVYLFPMVVKLEFQRFYLFLFAKEN